MRRFICRFLATANLIVAAVPAEPASRPRYGGLLRVEMRAGVRSLDPHDPPTDPKEATAKKRLAPLVYEGLVRFDESGRPAPRLALSWQHDAEKKRWQFRLRAGVKFHDGSPLTAAAVVAALSSGNKEWRLSAVSEGVVIEANHPMPELLSELAEVRSCVFRPVVGATASGTGAFRISRWEAGRRALLTANEFYWGGRPFLDAVAVEMGRSPQEQWLDFELGKADFVELGPSEARRAAERRTKVWTSAPLELIALVFERSQRNVEDLRQRQAIALAIDRGAMHSVLLQKQGEPAGGLLPHWLSGYAFLFPNARDSARSKGLLAASPTLQPLALAYDSSDPLAKAVAERIDVNLREVGIKLRLSGQSASRGQADLRLARWRIHSTQPGQALSELAAALDLHGVETVPNPASLEAVYAVERGLVEDFRVIPLFHVPEVYGLSLNVRSWVRPGVLKTGDWRFEDVWLDLEKP